MRLKYLFFYIIGTIIGCLFLYFILFIAYTIKNSPEPQIELILPSREELEPSIELQIHQIAYEFNADVDLLLKLAHCESTLNPQAIGKIDNRDRGLFQINSYHHPEVSDQCAFDVFCSTVWTINRINTGYLHEWTCAEKI